MNNRLFEAITQVGDDLSAAELAVLQQLVFMCNDKGECWPRTKKLASRMHRSVRRVQKVMKALRVKGYVRVVHEATPYTPPLYRIVIPGSGDTGEDAAQRTRESQRSVPESRSTANLSVPAQAGTNINPKKEPKREPIKSEKKDVPLEPCTYPGCIVMARGGRCASHPMKRNRG